MGGNKQMADFIVRHNVPHDCTNMFKSPTYPQNHFCSGVIDQPVLKTKQNKTSLRTVMSREAIATRTWCFFIFTAIYLLPAMYRTHLLSVVALVLSVTANRIPKYYHVLIKIPRAAILPNHEFVEILEQLTSAKKNPSAHLFSRASDLS